ncbi:tRNA-binding protein [Patescibacteria group bacterium]|nr:tRNA-binding protein [Patescibacteria group bacterium]
MATFQDFENIEIRVGTIVAVSDFPEARKPAYKLDIDLGVLGIKKSSAQITHLYTKEELIGKRVVCVTNIGTRTIGSFVSEVLTTGFYREDGSVVLAVPDKDIPNGARLG